MGKMLRMSVALVLAAFTTNGQSVTGTILGTVTDTSSAVISSAKVTATSTCLITTTLEVRDRIARSPLPSDGSPASAIRAKSNSASSSFFS
jgi:hypothetical protein